MEWDDTPWPRAMNRVSDEKVLRGPADDYCSNPKMRFQSFFMLMTVQPLFFAWS